MIAFKYKLFVEFPTKLHQTSGTYISMNMHLECLVLYFFGNFLFFCDDFYFSSADLKLSNLDGVVQLKRQLRMTKSIQK